MRTRYLVLAFALVAALAAGQQEPYPGQSSHAEPPKDFFCSNHPNAPKAHKCDCQKTCAKPTDEEGNTVDGPLVVTEDPKCTVWCHKDHCACALKCSET
jgi:hypothetical protein